MSLLILPAHAANEAVEREMFNNLLKGHFVFGVPNFARVGGSYHRALAQHGSLMLTLGGGANLGLAAGDTFAGFKRIGIEEQYINVGLLPGIHWHTPGSRMLYALSGIVGVQYGSLTVSNPFTPRASEAGQYTVAGSTVRLLQPHVGIEAGVYAVFSPLFLGIELGFVAAPRATIAYTIQENGVDKTQEYYAPSIRYGGTRVAVVVGAFF